MIAKMRGDQPSCNSACTQDVRNALWQVFLVPGNLNFSWFQQWKRHCWEVRKLSPHRSSDGNCRATNKRCWVVTNFSYNSRPIPCCIPPIILKHLPCPDGMGCTMMKVTANKVFVEQRSSCCICAEHTQGHREKSSPANDDSSVLEKEYRHANCQKQ